MSELRYTHHLIYYVAVYSCVCMYVQWVPEIAHHCPGTPFILAGTKLDLLSGDNDNSVSTLKVLADI